MQEPLYLMTSFTVNNSITLKLTLAGTIDLNTNKSEPNNLKLFLDEVRRILSVMVGNDKINAIQLFSESSEIASNFVKNNVKDFATECKIEMLTLNVSYIDE
jgi:hypothetical protein